MNDALWYKDAVIYQLHVRAFADSDGDGVGDLAGLTGKLDYLHDLGVTALWLLPFYPSPLKDDGYDIADYTAVNPAYGTLADFKTFLREAHRRGLRVITELVINHTSDQHPWFQRARRARPGSVHRDFYVWSAHPDKYLDARIIFKDFETSNWAWDPLAQAYYWHRFYTHQPDLNFDSPRVRKAVLKVLDFWLELGVDGLRLDAVPYLYEREGTNCENLAETHAFLRELRAHVDRHFPNRMLLAEANQWPEDAVAYFGAAGDECHMNFHFPVMPRMFMSLQMEDRFPLIDILKQTPHIPGGAQWAMFLRNHDELTLEMVTDEERDYMYRMYAHDVQARINLGIRRRLAPLVGNSRRKIELLYALLCSLPGTPILYYGDEIGIGDNIYLGDRNGVRTPMQWSPGRNAGFSTANPQKLYLPVIIDPEYHYEAVNVESQQRNPQSLLWWTKRLIALRRRHPAFGRGDLRFLYPDNPKVLAFVRATEGETLLVVANLSRYVQYAELDLAAFRGRVPTELFGLSAFPPVGEGPYPLTLGAHNFYWFSLHEAAAAEPPPQVRPALAAVGDWRALFAREYRGAFETLLPAYLRTRRWFAGKAWKIKHALVEEFIPFGNGAAIVFVRVEYADAEPETYQVALAFATGPNAARIAERAPGAVLASVALDGRTPVTGLLVEATADPEFNRQLLRAVERRRTFRGQSGEVTATPYMDFRRLHGGDEAALTPAPLQGEQSNTSVVYGSRLILKLVRRVEEGENPELELGRYFADRAAAVSVPPMAGALEYRRGRGAAATLAVVQGYVHNEGNAWRFTLDSLGMYFDKALAYQADGHAAPRPLSMSEALLTAALPEPARALLATYADAAELLAQRTAEFHAALAAGTGLPGFAPEPFSTLYQRSLYQSLRNQTARALGLLSRSLRTLDKPTRDAAERVLALEERLQARFARLLERKLSAQRIRIHGDYHLGQVLYTGNDFVIIDFEGEPLRSLTERRIKRSPLRDVAGMLRSFQYAAATALGRSRDQGADPAAEEQWAAAWAGWAAAVFWQSYRAHAPAHLLPSSLDDTLAMLHVYLIDKAMYEIVYELGHRPPWVGVPLAGILQLVEQP
jgi:maltose alpha-D-glucosyltransferase/alpha-amylase